MSPFSGCFSLEALCHSGQEHRGRSQIAYLCVLCSNLKQFTNSLCNSVVSSVKWGDDISISNRTVMWFK